jgi:hypothetical membrane protein
VIGSFSTGNLTLMLAGILSLIVSLLLMRDAKKLDKKSKAIKKNTKKKLKKN